jgi:hypothetical protein
LSGNPAQPLFILAQEIDPVAAVCGGPDALLRPQPLPI